MHHKKMFAGMDLQSRRFYSRILNTALFNIYAVRNSLFPELLCESNDPAILSKWEDAESRLIEAIRICRAVDQSDGCIQTDF
jgi:hypothetical protein